MNEELQKQIADILKQAIEAAHKGGQWMAGQIPDVLHQLIVWTIVQGIVSVVTFFVVFTVGYFATNKWASQELAYADMWKTPKLISCAAWLVGSFMFFIAAIVSGMDALKAIFAPKIFLLEYAAHLVK